MTMVLKIHVMHTIKLWEIIFIQHIKREGQTFSFWEAVFLFSDFSSGKEAYDRQYDRDNQQNDSKLLDNPATPPNPNKLATAAITAKIIARRNICFSLLLWTLFLKYNCAPAVAVCGGFVDELSALLNIDKQLK